jgi:large conductance mechanosensitive channel
MTSVLTGFKDFLLRGNVVELAVAVVIGAAFTAVVDQFAESFLTPLVNLVGGGGPLGGAVEVDGQVFTWGAFVSQLVTFVMTAAVVYFLVVLPMKALVERRARGEQPGPAQPTQVELLAEIRDLLRAQQAGPVQGTAGPLQGSATSP